MSVAMATIPCGVSCSGSGLRSGLAGESLNLRSCGSSIAGVSFQRQALRVECKESRIGKMPIEVPKEVQVSLEGGQFIKVKGPLGAAERRYPREVKVDWDDTGKITVTRMIESKRARAMHGLFRTLTDNLVQGVSKGFEKKLLLVGVGYRAAVEGNDVVLNVGYSHPVRVPIPEGIKATVEENTRITIFGFDKYMVGQYAAILRSKRKPEPYKGKGVRYQDEEIRLRAGKAGKKK